MSLPNKFNTVNADNRTGINLAYGVFEAIVMENRDSLLMGRLAVYIPELGGNVNDPQSWKTVRYASPFYGITPYKDSQLTPAGGSANWGVPGGTAPRDETDAEQNATQRNAAAGQGQGQQQGIVTSYGMWAVPPDLGVTVLVMFAGGDLNRGFWFACVPTVSHGMVPAIGAPDGKTPMAEFNPIDPQVSVTPGNLASIQRQPYEPLVKQFTAQGLAEDPIRGPITSSSFREAPSNVFGISSKGGHTFVMDDGVVPGGTSKLIRLRTAGGNQITMHDDSGMIYMTNAKGTGWIELSPSGQIDVFGAAGINLATNGDINLHADKNVNIHAGNCVKITGTVGTKVMGGQELQLHGAKTMIEGVDSLHVHSCTEMMFTSFGDIHMKAFNYFCLKGKCFYWNSCTAKEAEQVPPEQPSDVSGYQTTVARAPSKEPYKEHDSGKGGGGGAAGGNFGEDGPASGATSGSMTGNGSENAGSIVGGTGKPFTFSGNQQQAFDTMYSAAVKAKSPDPKMTASIAMLESGYLNSSMTKRANNPFGQTIKQSQIGTNGIVGGTVGADGQLHAVYENVDVAVADHVRRWGNNYIPDNPTQTTSALVGKGYNTVNGKWAGSVNSIYASSNNTNKSSSTNAANASLTPSTSIGTPATSSSKIVTPTNETVRSYSNIKNASSPTVIKAPTSSRTTVMQGAVRTGNNSTTTSVYKPATSVSGGPGAPLYNKPATIEVTKTTTTQVGPNAGTARTTSTTQTIDVSSSAANPYLGRGGAQPVGADPALANVPSKGQQPAGVFDSPNPADQAVTGQTPAQEASSALNQTAGQSASSDIPAAPGGGSTGCFATGDNCERPADETGGTPGGGDTGADGQGPAENGPGDGYPEGVSRQQVEDEIRKQAIARGMDPDKAVAVARSEGLNKYIGDNGFSGGPYQLYYGSKGGGGLGTEFTRQTGINALTDRSFNSIQKQISFSMDYAKKNGWQSAWYGARKIGVTGS